jgi:hypothetical protein
MLPYMEPYQSMHLHLDEEKIMLVQSMYRKYLNATFSLVQSDKKLHYWAKESPKNSTNLHL